VARVPIPSGSLIEKVSDAADYADSYAATVPGALFADFRTLARFAFQRGTLAGETTEEVMYTGCSPGLVYHVSYLRRNDGGETKLFVSTAVRYTSRQGRLYFAVVRPGHRVLTPFMVSVMIRRAGAEAG
jgi:hypothetical protein